MSPKVIKGAMAVIALAVLHVFLFLVIRRFFPVFWISYLFLMIAWVTTIFLAVFDIGKEKRIFGYPLAAIAVYYLAAETVAAFVCIFLLRFFPILAFLIQLAILAVFLILYLSMKKVNVDIGKRQEERGRDISNFNFILESARRIQNRVEYASPWRKQVERAVDALASGQVKSDPSAAGTERAILQKIEDLEKAVDGKKEEEIAACCLEIERLSGERSRILRSAGDRF